MALSTPTHGGCHQLSQVLHLMDPDLLDGQVLAVFLQIPQSYFPGMVVLLTDNCLELITAWN